MHDTIWKKIRTLSLFSLYFRRTDFTRKLRLNSIWGAEVSAYKRANFFPSFQASNIPWKLQNLFYQHSNKKAFSYSMRSPAKSCKNQSKTHPSPNQELCDLAQKIAIFILRSKVQIEAFFVRQTQIANHTYDHETLSTLLKPSLIENYVTEPLKEQNCHFC